MEMDFVYLGDNDSLASIDSESKVIKPIQHSDEEIPQFNVNLGETIKKQELQFDIPQLEHKPKVLSEEEVQWLESCGIEKYYGDASPDDYFRRENLFSELVDDYQRAKARYNLGIGEEYSLVWGNISGSIENQTDLYEYITNRFIEYTNRYVEDVNTLLVNWGLEINFLLSRKIDKDSPHLEGTPTTTLPEIEDDSDRIASTKWVNTKLSLLTDYNLKWLKVNKDYMFIDDPPQNIILTWEFYNIPEEIVINGQSVNPSASSYTFRNINNSFLIHFSYKINDKWYNQAITFQKVNAYYYGTEEDPNTMSKTKETSIIVNSLEDKFVYLYIPNDGKARLFVNNILGGFINLGGRLINGVGYYLYRTVHPGLGELHITYDKQ